MPPGFRFAFSLLFILVASVTVADDDSSSKMRRYVFSEAHMGTKFRILLYGPNQATANETAAAAYTRITELNAILSDYDEESEVRRLCTTSGKGNAVAVSPPLFEVLTAAQRLSVDSGGAFDVTVGPLVVLWRRARRTKQKPTDIAIQKAMTSVGYSHIVLNNPNSVTLNRSEMRIDLGAIAKGYAADQALKVISKAGITSALIDAGGDIVCTDAPPGKSAWVVAVGKKTAESDDRTLLRISNAAVATSGDQFQFIEIDGQRFSHIVDPKTGLGLTTRRTVTVIAKDGMTADGIASAISVMGKSGFKLLSKNAAAMIKQSDPPKVIRSTNFDKSLYRAEAKTVRPAQTAP